MVDQTQDGTPAAQDPRIESVEEAEAASATPLRRDVVKPNAFVREFRSEDNKAEARDAAEGTATEARVAGELATEAEQERIAAEQLVARLRTDGPGSAALADAEAALARIEDAAAAADAASLDADTAAEEAATDAAKGRHASGMADQAEYLRGTADVAKATTALTDADAATKQLEADRKAIET